MMLGEASSLFCTTVAGNAKIQKYSNFEPNAQHGSRVMCIFTTRARPAKMMLGEASSSFFIPVAGNVKIHKYTKFEQNIPRESRVMIIFIN